MKHIIETLDYEGIGKALIEICQVNPMIAKRFALWSARKSAISARNNIVDRLLGATQMYLDFDISIEDLTHIERDTRLSLAPNDYDRSRMIAAKYAALAAMTLSCGCFVLQAVFISGLSHPIKENQKTKLREILEAGEWI